MKFVGYALIGCLSALGGAGLMYLREAPSPRYEGGAKLEALTRLTPKDAAEQFLPSLAEHLSSRVVAVTTHGSVESWEPWNEAVADGVSFRLRAEAFGLGLCRADNLNISLETATRAGGSETVQPDGGLDVRSSYRIVGDTTPDREWTDAYKAELNTLCEAQGADALFFTVTEESQLRTLTDMLPALLAGASNARIDCRGHEAACRSPVDLLRNLSPGRLIRVSSAIDCLKTDQTCLELTYLAEPEGALRAARPDQSNGPPPLWGVRAKGRYIGNYPTGWGKLVLSEVEIIYS